MYKITVIETAQELLDALDPHKVHSSDKPQIGKDKVSLEYDNGVLNLKCSDEKFDISRVEPLDVLNHIISEKRMNLVINKPQKAPTMSKGMG